MRVHRTHDGRSFDIDRALSHFRTREDLFDAFSLTTGIPSDDLICMTRSGQQVNDEVLDQIQEDEERGPSSSRKDVSVEFFIFNRQFLYADLEPLVQELEEVALLEAPVDEPELHLPPTPRMLDDLLEWCAMLIYNMTNHNARSEGSLSQLRTIDEGTNVALSNLLSHAESVRSGAGDMQSSTRKELDRMQGLLRGHEIDLKILALVRINPKLLPTTDSGKAKPKDRTLADYVSPTKMGAVFQACNSVHSELKTGLDVLQSNGVQLAEDTEGLKTEVQSTSVEPSVETFQEAAQALTRAYELQRFLEANIAPDEHGWPAADRLSKDVSTMRAVEDAAGELILLDEVCRESLRRLSADKNDMMARSLHLLSDISSLQSEYADLSIELSQLDAEFKSNRTDGFRHLARLKNMLWAYGSTVIEIYRRKEFEKHFLLRSQALAELMANFSEGESRRRSHFRNQVAGALPWEIKGVEENTPSLEISTGPSNGAEFSAHVDRDDIEGLFQALNEIESKLQGAEEARSISDIRSSLQQLMTQMEQAEQEFTRLVEVGLLSRQDDVDSDEEDGSPRPRASAKANKLVQEKARVEKELQDVKIEHGERERSMAQAHDREMAALRAELSKMKSDVRSAEHILESERTQHEETKRSLDTFRADAETEAARRINMQEELSRLRQDNEAAIRAEKIARGEASEEAERANDLEAHLHDIQMELEEIKSAHHDASKRVEALLSKGTSFERELQVAQERIDELTQHLSEARSESREARDALSEAEAARDKALRSYRAEADGDRAILEESLRSQAVDLEQLRSHVKRKESELLEQVDSVRNLQSQLTAADQAHEELVRQLESAKEACMDSEMSKRQSDRNLEAILEKTQVLISQSILLSETLKKSPSLSGQTTKSGNKPVQGTVDKLDEKAEQERQEAFDAFKSAGNNVSFNMVINALGWLSKVPAEEAAIGRLESLTTLCKKWMKAYKHTNDKGQRQQLMLREKITFRNFSVGDLALFLPTRSNAAASSTTDSSAGSAVINFAKPWAAFNINFPHYFLNFGGKPENQQLRDSLRQKEWIVARITKIESKVASSSEPDGNPFQLAEGVKFYLLEVENWNLANSAVAPSVSRRKSASTAVGSVNGKAPPSLRRWESTPDGISVEQAAVADTEAEQAREDAAKAGVLPDRLKSTNSPPLAEVAEEVPSREGISASPPLSTAPSGLALALQHRISPSELLRYGRAQKSASTHTGDLPANSAATGFARWTGARGRAQSGTTGSVTSSSSVVSDRQAQRLIESATPAFGRSKRLTSQYTGSGHPALQAGSSIPSPSGGHPVDVSQSVPKDIGAAKPIQAVQRAMRTSDETPNPFSASPAPGTAPEGGLEEVHTRRKESLLRGASSDTTDPLSNANGKGKAKDYGQISSDMVSEEENDERLAYHRPASRSSHTSVSSRLSALNIRSRPAAIAAPRVRASATLKPTIETAQGLNSFGHAAALTEDVAGPSSTMGSQPSGSGFSMRSASNSAGSSGLSTAMMQNERVSGARRTASTTSVNSSSPASTRRSFFGGQWTLGRRAGSQVQSTSHAQASDEDNEHEADLSATVTDAKQSLRRLASFK